MNKRITAACAMAISLLTVTKAVAMESPKKDSDSERSGCGLHGLHPGHKHPLEALRRCDSVKALADLRTCMGKVMLGTNQYRECAQGIHAAAEAIAIASQKGGGSHPDAEERLAAHVEWREGPEGTATVFKHVNELVQQIATLYTALAFRNDHLCAKAELDDGLEDL